MSKQNLDETIAQQEKAIIDHSPLLRKTMTSLLYLCYFFVLIVCLCGLYLMVTYVQFLFS